MAINHVVLTGTCADLGPKLTYNAASAKPECQLTLVVEVDELGPGEQVYTTYLPVDITGCCAEQTAVDPSSRMCGGEIVAPGGAGEAMPRKKGVRYPPT
jgi:hypothetical protein